MKKFLILSLILSSPFLATMGFAALDRVGDFALLDNQGEFHQLSRYRHKQALAVMSWDAECEDMQDSLSKFESARSQFAEQGVEFLLIDSRDIGRNALQQFDLSMPVLEDDGQLVSETLGIRHAGDVLVLNPQRLSIYYRGTASEELSATLVEVLVDSLADTIEIQEQEDGCAIDYPRKSSHIENPPDYSSQVAPIIADNCAICHRQEGVGPFALDSYIMLLGWSPMIREVLLNKRMPPMQIDPYIGHSDNARYLSKQDLQTVVHWIDAGAPRGAGESDPLEELVTGVGSTWQLGEPDYIVTAPDIDVAATGVMDYIYDEVELPFEEDKWLRAVQYLPGDSSVLHHLMTFVTAPEEDFWGAERDELSVTRRFVEGYAPGGPAAVEFPAGSAVLIPQDHKLSMQFHYVTNGQSTVDTTRLGLYFSDEPGLKEKLVQAVSSRFVLPPNEAYFPMQAEHVFDKDIVIFGVRARMNYRGKEMKFVIETVDGSTRELLSVPAYNYGWQPHYVLDEAVRVAAGSKLRVVGAFDNSISNPLNPDPEKELRFGLNSWDEMFTGYFSFYVDE